MKTQEQIRNEIYHERHTIFQHEQKIRALEQELSQAKKTPAENEQEAAKLREELKALME